MSRKMSPVESVESCGTSDESTVRSATEAAWTAHGSQLQGEYAGFFQVLFLVRRKVEYGLSWLSAE